MVEEQFNSLIRFADILGFVCLKSRNSGKPYFKEVVPFCGKTVLTLDEMQQLYNKPARNIINNCWHTKVFSCDKESNLIFRNLETVREAFLSKDFNTIQLQWIKSIGKLVTTSEWQETLCKSKK